MIDGLRAQSLPLEHWQLVLVDNASSVNLGNVWDFSWHPAFHYVREHSLGLVQARVRGIAESSGEILVFVDDDNVFSPNYLLEASKISASYPFIGTWGGSSRAEFESPPPSWSKEFWPALAIREFDTIRWSNTLDDWRAQPCGAGLCIRRKVAENYAVRVRSDPCLARTGSTGRCSDERRRHRFGVYGSARRLWVGHVSRARVDSPYSCDANN